MSPHATGVNCARAGGEGAGFDGGGTVWHAVTSAPAATASARRKRKDMEWILLEALVALLVGIAIVWWTMAARRKPPRDDQ
jgi:hypothetical protein